MDGSGGMRKGKGREVKEWNRGWKLRHGLLEG